MNAEIARRETELAQISSIIDNSLCAFKAVIKELGWTEESIMEQSNDNDEIVTCPLDSGHRMPKRSLEKHLETCTWISKGYTREEKEKALPSSHYFYTNSTSVVPVLIDKETQFSIFSEAAKNGQLDLGGSAPAVKEVPLTMDRCVTELTPQERFAIYDYAVARAKATNKQLSFCLEDLQINFEEKPDEGNRKKSRIEILAELRDYKRRRQSYRAKNVHITKKSYTEILREVIQNQVEYLQRMLKNDDELDKSPSPSPRNSRSRSTTPSREMKKVSPGDMEKLDEHRNRHHKNKSNHRHRSRSRERSRKRKKWSDDDDYDTHSSTSSKHDVKKAEHRGHEDSDHERHRSKHKKHKHKHKHRKRGNSEDRH